jgi:peptidoglycan/LPS O-acetylase OafA/YrhL
MSAAPDQHPPPGDLQALPTRPRPVSNERHANNFDAVRLFAAISVVIQHAALHLHAGFLWYTPDNGLWFFDGVALFFVLSGAMVYASADKCARQGRPTRDYLRNRLLRVVPAIYAYLAVMVLVLFGLGVVAVTTAADPHLWAWVASTAVLVPVYHPPTFAHFGVGVVNGSLWTIPAEVSFYLSVPVLVWLSRRAGFWPTILSALATGLAGAAVYGMLGGSIAAQMTGKLLGITFVPWLGYFMIGVVVARLWRHLPHSGYLTVVAVAAYLGCRWLRGEVPAGASPVIAVAGALPLAYLAFWVGYRGPAMLRRITGRIGDLSFGVYIWHMPVINLLIWWGARRGPLHGTVLVTLVLVVSLGLAFMSWRLVEKPALRLKRYTTRAA